MTQDARHSACQMLSCEPVSTREFAGLSMGATNVSDAEASGSIAGAMLSGDATSYQEDGIKLLKTFLTAEVEV